LSSQASRYVLPLIFERTRWLLPQVSQRATPENDGPVEFGPELLLRASRRLEPPPLGTAGGSSGHQSATGASKGAAAAGSAVSLVDGNGLAVPIELHSFAPPYDVRAAAACAAGAHYLMLGGNVPHSRDPSGTRLPLVASDQLCVLDCAANQWHRCNARALLPAGLHTPVGDATPLCRAGHAVCFLDGRLWVRALFGMLARSVNHPPPSPLLLLPVRSPFV